MTKYLSHEPMFFSGPRKEFRSEEQQAPLYADRFPELVDEEKDEEKSE